MNIEKAKANVERLLSDKYGSGSINAMKQLFDVLTKCGVGYTANREDRKSANHGPFDIHNHEALMTVLTDRETIRELVRRWYYRHENKDFDCKED
tara:strand:+ start:14133 stop:14417 length:285 start_codon:yes stop_codon:yes gene_type:complete